MSTVTNIILTFDILEDEEARMVEVNSYFKPDCYPYPGFGRQILGNQGDPGIDPYIGGDKNLEAPVFVGAFNCMGNDEFFGHLRTKVAWEYPKNVRCYREMQEEDAFREVFQTPSGDIVDVQADLSVALDILEDEQWDGDTYATPGEPDPGCSTCGASEITRTHKPDCKRALLLRKYGRKVKIQGDP